MGLQEKKKKKKYVSTLPFQPEYFEKSHQDNKFQAQLDIIIFFILLLWNDTEHN